MLLKLNSKLNSKLYKYVITKKDFALFYDEFYFYTSIKHKQSNRSIAFRYFAEKERFVRIIEGKRQHVFELSKFFKIYLKNLNKKK